MNRKKRNHPKRIRKVKKIKRRIRKRDMTIVVMMMRRRKIMLVVNQKKRVKVN